MALKDKIKALEEEYGQYEYIIHEPKFSEKAPHITGLMCQIYARKLLLEELLEAYKDGKKPDKNKENTLTQRLNESNKYFREQVEKGKTSEGLEVEAEIDRFFNGSSKEKPETKEKRELPEIQSYQLIYTGIKNFFEMESAFELIDNIDKQAGKYTKEYIDEKIAIDEAYEELGKYPEQEWKEQMEARSQLQKDVKDLENQRSEWFNTKTREMEQNKQNRVDQFNKAKQERDKERGITLKERKAQHENESKQLKNKVEAFEKYYDNDYSTGIASYERKMQQLETYKNNADKQKTVDDKYYEEENNFYKIHEGSNSKELKHLMIFRRMIWQNTDISYTVEKMFDVEEFTEEQLDEPLEALDQELWDKYELQEFWFQYYLPSEEERKNLTLGDFKDFVKEMNGKFTEEFDFKKLKAQNDLYDRIEENNSWEDEIDALDKCDIYEKEYISSRKMEVKEVLEAIGDIMYYDKELARDHKVPHFVSELSIEDKNKYEAALQKVRECRNECDKVEKNMETSAKELGIKKQDDIEKKAKELEEEKKEIDNKLLEKLKEWNLDSEELEGLAGTGFKNAKLAVNQKTAPKIAEIDTKTEAVQKEIDKEEEELEKIDRLYEEEKTERENKYDEFTQKIEQKNKERKEIFKNENIRKQIEKIDSAETGINNLKMTGYKYGKVDVSPALNEMRKQAAIWLKKERLHAGNHKDSTEFKNMINAAKKFLAAKPESAEMESAVKELLDTSDKYLIAKNGQRRWFPTKMRKNRMTLAKVLKFNAGLVMQTIEKEKNKLDWDKEYEKNKDAIKTEALNKKNKEEADKKAQIEAQKKQAELEAKKKQAELEAQKKQAELEAKKKQAELAAKKKDKNSMTLEEKKADGDKYSAIMKKLDEYIAYIEDKADDGMVSDLSSDKRNALGLDVLVEELAAISQEEIEKLSVGEVYSLCRENKTKLNAEIEKEENKLKKPDTNKNVKKNTKLVSDKNLSLKEVKKILSNPKALAKNTTLFDFLENKEVFESEIYDKELENLTYQEMPKKCKELLSMDIMVNTFKIGTEDKINKMNCIDLMAAIDKLYKSETFEEAKRLHEKMNQPEMEDEGFER